MCFQCLEIFEAVPEMEVPAPETTMSLVRGGTAWRVETCVILGKIKEDIILERDLWQSFPFSFFCELEDSSSLTLR